MRTVLKKLFAAALAAASLIITALPIAAAGAPLTTGLLLKDAAGQVQTESTTQYNSQFLINHLDWGWDYSLSQPQALWVDGSGLTHMIDVNSAANLTATQAASTVLGAKGETACLADSGSCDIVQLIERTNARISSLITALGSPMQAGGYFGNSSFALTGTLPSFASPPTFNCGTGCYPANQPTTDVNSAAHLSAVQAAAGALGAKGETACSADSGSCDIVQLLERANARITSLIAALGSPMQAGGYFGNSSFALTGTLPSFASPPTFNCGTGCYPANQPTTDVNSAASLTAVQAGATNTANLSATLGAKGDAVCSADSGSCDVIQLLERTNGRLSSLIAAIGSPIQAGSGVIGWSGFVETSANLASGGSFIGATHTAPAWASYFRVRAISNLAGTLEILETLGSVGTASKTSTCSANVICEVFINVEGLGQPQVYFSNTGGAATTSLGIISGFTAN